MNRKRGGRRINELVVGGVLLLAMSTPASALSLYIPTQLGSFNTEVVSYQEAKFKSVIRQQYDFSCGSAAIASLLSFHYADPRTEQEVFRTMWANGDHALIREQGFSLLDMKRFLEHQGYRADGYRLTLDRLKKVGVPAITLINNNGYMHFVVIKGISDNEVLLGDPTLGVRTMSRDEFDSKWQNGIIFLIKNKVQLAKASFNTADAWQTIAAAPTRQEKTLATRSLADFNLLLPARSDF
jgi:predicted double-glycine peptidase